MLAQPQAPNFAKTSIMFTYWFLAPVSVPIAFSHWRGLGGTGWDGPPQNFWWGTEVLISLPPRKKNLWTLILDHTALAFLVTSQHLPTTLASSAEAQRSFLTQHDDSKASKFSGSNVMCTKNSWILLMWMLWCRKYVSRNDARACMFGKWLGLCVKCINKLPVQYIFGCCYLVGLLISLADLFRAS
jgi:hypothetical protein